MSVRQSLVLALSHAGVLDTFCTPAESVTLRLLLWGQWQLRASPCSLQPLRLLFKEPASCLGAVSGMCQSILIEM